MTRISRSDLVTVALPGDHAKPRPAVVIQSDLFDAHPGVTVLPVTSTLIDAPLLRITVQADQDTGLSTASQVMVDKAMTVKRERIGDCIGHVGSEVMVAIERSLAVCLGIAK